jgi:thiol:disulfide interchange protein DsbD
MRQLGSIRAFAVWAWAWAWAGLLCAPALLHAQTQFLEPDQAFRGQARLVDGHDLEVRLDVAPNYHLYRERSSIELASGAARLARVDFPAGTQEYDQTFQKNFEILRGAVRVPVALAQVTSDFKLRVTYQGCADRGLCYPPQTALVVASVRDGSIERVQWQTEDEASAPPPAARPDPAPPATPPAAQGLGVESALKSGSLLTIAGVFLLAGVLLAFTPCVLPMVPILSAIIVGQGASVSRARGLTLALAYALGMALIYTALGVVAGLLGEGLAAALQNPWVLGGFALLLGALSLSMFGAFELQMPVAVQSRLNEACSRLPGGRYAGVFVMGGLSALIVGPCVAAPLAGALVFIGQTKNVLIGGLALFCLAMGMSVPLLLVGASAGSLLPRAGAWMTLVKRFFGVLLLGVALWLVAPVLPSWATMALLGAALIAGAVGLRPFNRQVHPAPARRRWAQLGALLLAALGAAQLVGAASGGQDVIQPWVRLALGGGAASAAPPVAFQRIRSVGELDTALKTAGRPVMLDFYADWCVSCKEMEHLTFRDPSVHTRLGQALLLQADVTANSADDQALLKRFGLFGPPGIVFFDPQGHEQTDARVIGYLPPERFAGPLSSAGL